jgi:hypothetical protein
MTPQTPAAGISLSGDYGDATNYKVECACSSPDHAVHMWIELNGDDDAQDIQVGFYADTWTPWWNKYYNRFGCMWTLLTTGIVKYEHHFLLNKQAATNFAHTILNDVKKLEAKQNVKPGRKRRAGPKTADTI